MAQTVPQAKLKLVQSSEDKAKKARVGTGRDHLAPECGHMVVEW